MKKNTHRNRQPLPDAYLKELEANVFGALEIEPYRTAPKKVISFPKPWAWAASLLLFLGSYLFFDQYPQKINKEELDSLHIANYLSMDYDASALVEQTLYQTEIELPLMETENISPEAISEYLTPESTPFELNDSYDYKP